MPDGDTTSVDVLVIGAGGCGLTAALAAHEAGMEVAVLEKAGGLGGNTALSSGSIPAAGTVLQAAAGIVDTPEMFAADIRAASGFHDADELVDVLTARSAELIDFLLLHGISLSLVTTYRHVGHRVHRLHAPPARRGADLLTDLARAAEANGIPIAFGQPATALLTEGRRVVGARTGEDAIRAGAVILACNGFGANRELVARHCPAAARASYGGSPHSTGEAVTWAQSLDAATGNMGAYQGHAGLGVKTGALMTWTLVERGAVIVDAGGRRFGDETLGYSAFADIALSSSAPFWMVYDEAIRDDVCEGQPDFAEACAMGVALVDDSAKALARRVGLPPDPFTRTLAAAAEAASGGRADRFGRTDWGRGPLDGRLCATQIRPALFHTQGGLRVDGQARVLDIAGTAIPGLYAGGGAAMGISGRDGGRGYVSGNGLLSALGLGLIAGRAAAVAIGRSGGTDPQVASPMTTRNQHQTQHGG